MKVLYTLFTTVHLSFCLERFDEPVWGDNPSPSPGSIWCVSSRVVILLVDVRGLFLCFSVWRQVCSEVDLVFLVGPSHATFPQVSSVSAECSSVLRSNNEGAGFPCLFDDSCRDLGSSVVFLHEDVFSFVNLRQVMCSSVMVRLLRCLSNQKRLSNPVVLV